MFTEEAFEVIEDTESPEREKPTSGKLGKPTESLPGGWSPSGAPAGEEADVEGVSQKSLVSRQLFGISQGEVSAALLLPSHAKKIAHAMAKKLRPLIDQEEFGSVVDDAFELADLLKREGHSKISESLLDTIDACLDRLPDQQEQ